MLAMHLLRKISKKKNLKTQALLIVFFFSQIKMPKQVNLTLLQTINEIPVTE